MSDQEKKHEEKPEEKPACPISPRHSPSKDLPVLGKVVQRHEDRKSAGSAGRGAAPASAAGPDVPSHKRTLGHHIAARLYEIGIRDYFGVPGDYNLILLDQLLEDKRLNFIGCCNELNAGYAADGYARAKGASALVVTFNVGGLSALNAIAGAYSESLPLIVISGGPNSNDFATNRVLHHTTGEKRGFDTQLQCMKQVTCAQVVVQSLEDAHEQIDHAISEAIIHSKPCYIEVSCNLAGTPHESFTLEPVPYSITFKQSNQRSLEAAVNSAATLLNKAVKPVLVGGPRMKQCRALATFQSLSDASGYATAVMPSAKGLFNEQHENFIGTYWGAVSSNAVCEVVEASDLYLFAGPIVNDYTSVGYSTLITTDKMIKVEPFRVVICGRESYGCVLMKDFLEALAAKVKRNSLSLDMYKKFYVAEAPPSSSRSEDDPLLSKVFHGHVQEMLTADSAVLTETGDAWFWGQKLRLPEGATYEFQMQYGSIGWCTGAALGYSVATRGERRVISLVGDGSFQMSAQEVSTMIRYGTNTIFFLLNNGGYSIEVMIHDNIYNVIQNWDYKLFVEALANKSGKVFTERVRTEKELKAAIATAQSKPDHLAFIEVILAPDDTSKELLEWGSRVAAANSRPPNPQ